MKTVQFSMKLPVDLSGALDAWAGANDETRTAAAVHYMRAGIAAEGERPATAAQADEILAAVRALGAEQAPEPGFVGARAARDKADRPAGGIVEAIINNRGNARPLPALDPRLKCEPFRMPAARKEGSE